VDPTIIVMLVVLAALVFVMFRNSRKRKAQQEELQAKIVPGVEVMTNFGLYGTLVSADTAAGTSELEIAPGTVVKVHSATVVKVVDPSEVVGTPGAEPRSVEEAMAIANAEAEAREAAEKAAAEPEYGERVDAASDEVAAEKKPRAKKVSE
jgi:preprotein translocase subunit YajC